MQETRNGLSHRASNELVLEGFANQRLCVKDQRVEAAVLAEQWTGLVEERLDRARVLRYGPTDVHAHHVRGAFPNAVQRCFAIEASHRTFLDEAVAAVTLQRFVGDGRGARAVEELSRWSGHAGQQAFVLEIRELVGRLGDAQRHQRCGLDLDGHVSEHVGHHRPVRDRRAEGLARGRVLLSQGERLAHQAGGADREVQPGQVRMRQDLADAVAFLADADRHRARIFDFA